MKKQPTMEDILKESVEKADQKGRLNTIVEDVYKVCDTYVDPQHRTRAVGDMMRCCYRFAEVIRDMRDAVMKDSVKEYMQSEGFARNLDKAFLMGIVCGAAWLAAMILVIDFVRSI